MGGRGRIPVLTDAQIKKAKSVQRRGNQNKSTKDTLTALEERFCQEYIVDFNAQAAMTRAGYKSGGQRHSGRVMGVPAVQARIAELMADMERAVKVEIRHVVNHAIRAATFDVRRLAKANGEMKAPHELDDLTASLLNGIKYTDKYDSEGSFVGRTIEYKLIEKGAMLTLLGRYLGMFAPDILAPPADEWATLLREIDGRSKGGPPLLRVIDGSAERADNAA